MFFAIDLDTVTPGIQLVVAPVFLSTTVAAIIGTVTGRLARIVDRARLLEDRIETVPALQISRIATIFFLSGVVSFYMSRSILFERQECLGTVTMKLGQLEIAPIPGAARLALTC